MRIVVLVKEVPDTYGDRKLSLETGLADRGASEAVLDEIGERAIEVALSYADKDPGTEVVVLSMTPESASSTVRKGLAMGAASAVHVVDEALLGADLGLTAEVLAAAVKRTGFDLVIAGNQSTDGSGGVIPAMVAEILDVPAATYLTSVEIGEGTVSGTRAVEGATMSVSTALPALISITEALPDARFPNFKGIMAAKKKPFETLSLDDLGIDPHDPNASRSIVIGLSEKPPREAGTKIVDEGDAGEKLAAFLIQNRLA
ncbi:electron transfer flavoprotein subunit beta/FixA family protein [Microbacterium sp. CFH 31415]|uniref:electron transfer flavoprotein subunit beta/FixA family protein n=1 Tax=Microbacterium sp. CFH 31415 TaxID=2921732 RepID=UPI001F129561|nr:electron transfer flavoprotein subunit beta/FixA family protein [Microbacterium sp. CFH 31415]MCH6231581.1 electron transfer flavoprotein subunit beta/FixA family protein [Microbacterium sp. CFH 31415]